MKRFILTIISLLIVSGVGFSQEFNKSSKDSYTVVTTSKSSKTLKEVKTAFTVKVNDTVYDIYTKSGEAFYYYKKSQKTGKDYKVYLKSPLKEEIAKQYKNR